MAHQLSCLSNLSSLTLTTNNLSQYQFPLHGAPAISYYKPTPSKHFHVNNSSSSSDNDDSTNYKIDRRKMVLGLGASNLLVSGSKPAFSEDKIKGPLKPPSFKSCGPPENADPTGPPLPEGTKCCLPTSDKIIDYELPVSRIVRKRRAAHKPTSTEDMRKYARALAKMKELPPEDPRSFTMQANVHCAYCNHVYHQDGTNKGLPIQVHFSWLFFPFHRWYLYFYERILGSLIDDPTFALPYWNWDNPQGMPVPPLFQDQGPTYGALYNPKRDQSNVNGAVVNYAFSPATDDATRIINNSVSLSTQMVTELCDVYDFMGQPYGQGIDATSAGQGSVERVSHTNIHWLVGDPRSGNLHEDMGNFYSAGRDPVFYSHHANVDRLWSIWSRLPADYDKNIRRNEYLEASFLFYNENSELCRVKVKDCLDHRKMGYFYEYSDISSWLQINRTGQSDSAKTKISAAKEKAPKAETTFPLKLDDTVRVVVKKAKTGQADEILVLEDITLKCNSFAKFDVFVNDEDDDGDFTRFDKAAYAGSFSYAPLGGDSNSQIKSFTRLRLTTLYNNMDVEGDDTIIVTLVPTRTPGDQAVTIGAIKVIECPHRA